MNRARQSITFLFMFGLAFCLIACQATDMTVKRESLAMTGGETTQTAAAAGPAITAIKTMVQDRLTKVVLEGDHKMTYTAHQQAQPPAILVDVKAPVVDNIKGVTPVNQGVVDKIEVVPVSGSKSVSRFKIGLTEQATYKVSHEGRNLVVALKSTALDDMAFEEKDLKPSQMSGTASIKDVEFKALDNTGRTRLIIHSTKKITPQIMTKDGGRTVVLSMSPAVMSKRVLSLPLNTTYFQSAVNNVKPRQVKGRSVDFNIRLREVVPYHLGQKGLVTYVDFDPSGMTPPTTALKKSDVRALPPAKTEEGQTALPALPARVPSIPAPPQSSTMMPSPSSPAAEMGAGMRGVEQIGETQTTFGAPDETKTVIRNYAGQKRISLDFQNADIHNILRLIGEVSGMNVVVSDKVSGRVTIKMEDVPWGQALDVILSSQQLDVVVSGNVMRIDTKENILKEKRALVEEQKAEKERQKSLPPIKRVFTPKYRSANDLGTEMTKLFATKTTDKDGTSNESIAVIGNSIYAMADEETMPLLVDIFNRLDQPTNQILIESRIIEASTTFSRDLGVNWGRRAGGAFFTTPNASGGNDVNYGVRESEVNSYGLFGGGTSSEPGMAVNLVDPTNVAYGAAIGIGFLSDSLTLDAHLYASEQSGDIRIVSAPRIMAQNDETVYIKQGTSYAYETVSDSGTNVEYKDADLKLEVTPHVEENGQVITLDVLIVKDRVNTAAARNPPIDTSEAKTKLKVRNGETVVIGGIISDRESKIINRVPGLHRVPVLGYLFKNDNANNLKNELLIFLTSHIIPVAIK